MDTSPATPRETDTRQYRTNSVSEVVAVVSFHKPDPSKVRSQRAAQVPTFRQAATKELLVIANRGNALRFRVLMGSGGCYLWHIPGGG